MTPNAPRPTLFTPSYIGDLERLLLMRRSLRRFLASPCRHIVAVPESDMRAFRSALGSDDCELIAQQSLVDGRYFPHAAYRLITGIAPNQAWRFSRWAGRPGWIVQQIAKLGAAALCGASAPMVVVDSDLFFVRPFGLDDIAPPGRRVLVREEPDSESGKHREHIAGARRLLGLPPGGTEHHYMAYPAIMYPDWVAALLKHIESVHGRPWQDVLRGTETFSEYSLYGIFVEEVLAPRDLVRRDQPFNLILWDQTSFADFFRAPQSALDRNPERICVVAQSNLGIPTRTYHQAVEDLLQRT